MSDAEEGTPIVIETEHGITINVPRPDIRVPVEFQPQVDVQVHVAALRRDVLLGIIAAVLIIGLFVW